MLGKKHMNAMVIRCKQGDQELSEPHRGKVVVLQSSFAQNSLPRAVQMSFGGDGSAKDWCMMSIGAGLAAKSSGAQAERTLTLQPITSACTKFQA